MENFAFEHNGQTFWYSRSMTTVAYIFAYDKNIKEWCILANKRGPGCPTNIDKWNVPCGYVEHNINAVANCLKEIHEETGLSLKKYQINFLWLDTQPKGNKQNLDCSFYAILDKSPDDYKTSAEFCEPGEVDDIQWIPISQLNKFNFAFNQSYKIMKVYEKYVNIGFFRKTMFKLTNWLSKRYLFNPIK